MRRSFSEKVSRIKFYISSREKKEYSWRKEISNEFSHNTDKGRDGVICFEDNPSLSLKIVLFFFLFILSSNFWFTKIALPFSGMQSISRHFLSHPEKTLGMSCLFHPKKTLATSCLYTRDVTQTFLMNFMNVVSWWWCWETDTRETLVHVTQKERILILKVKLLIVVVMH